MNKIFHKISIVGILFLIYISNVSAVPENINWDCEQYNALETNGIIWTENSNLACTGGCAPGWCSLGFYSNSYKITEDGESIGFYIHTHPLGELSCHGNVIKTLTSELINVDDVDSISIWFKGHATSIGGNGHGYASIRLLNSTDHCIGYTTLVSYSHGIAYTENYDCTNVSIYDGRTWCCNNISVVESQIKIQLYMSCYSTYSWGTDYFYVDMIRFNEICDEGAPNPPLPPLENSTFNLYDDCGNLLQNATTTIFKDMTTQIYQGNDNPIVLLESGNYSRYDQLRIIIDTHDMAVEKIVYADDEYNIFNLVHNNVDWNMQIYVYDNTTGDPIEGVKVISHQDCRIAGSLSRYSLTNEYGFIVTHDLSNQNISVSTYHVDYGNYDKNIIPDFNAWYGLYSINIFLDNTSEGGGGNTTLPELPCSTAWSNNDNVIISEINDSEDARLHYMTGNCTTLLYLERWSESIDMWIMIGSSITLDPLDSGYIQYTPANWTEDETTIYRGRLWAIYCYCDDTTELKVWNVSDNNITIYQNLTANIQFQNKVSGHYVNPGIPIAIKAYAASNNTSLCSIDLKLYNESVLTDSLSLTFFDWYVSGVFVPYYWYPNHDYADGFNYTIRMYGLNDALLDIDHVFSNASTENPYNTFNTLTINVKDNRGVGITQATVFIEGWGSQSLTSSTYGVISGLPNGECQYKATKSGYITSGWDTITLSGADETVTCILSKQSTESITGYKLKDQEVKAFLIPLLYLLFILIIVGGVINAAKP